MLQSKTKLGVPIVKSGVPTVWMSYLVIESRQQSGWVIGILLESSWLSGNQWDLGSELPSLGEEFH